MSFPWRLAMVAGFLAICALLTATAHAADQSVKLRKEKARLMEMRGKAEKTAAELAETLRREKMSRTRMNDLEERLARQRRFIAKIDRRLSQLGMQMDRKGREARALDEERGKVHGKLNSVSLAVFADQRSTIGMPPEGSSGERNRYFARRIMSEELERFGRLTADRDRMEKELSGIERRIEDSERRMAQQKIEGDKLATRQEKERKLLAEIEAKKKKKARELSALRSRIARMEALVSRIERKAAVKKSGTDKPEKAGPSRFSGVSGGLVPPLVGKVVGRFGKQRDPVFDVDVENRGVEIEARSGAAIHAVGKGEVVFIGGVSGFGKVLIIQHGSGLFSVYGKAEGFTVKQGQAVVAGEVVGQLPASPDGKSVLYLELRAGGTAIDPSAAIPLSR